MAVAVQPSMEGATKKKPPIKHRRVVVTGMGVETSIGNDPDVFYNNLLEGVSGISEIEGFDISNYPTVSMFCTRSSIGKIFMVFGSYCNVLNRKLLERLNLSRLTDGLHRNCPKGWTNLCCTC